LLESNDGFPVFSGYRITGYAKEFLYKDSMLLVVARGVGGTGDVKVSPPESWITNLSIVLQTKDELVDKFYLKNLLNREKLKDKLNTGAAQAQITIESLSRYKVKIPSLKEQKTVISFISKYDDLIENNKRRIALLEESARLLYREWFVHFHFPGHEHVKINDGLPEGWNKKKYVDILGKVKKKGKAKKEEYQPVGLFPCIDQSKDFIGGYVDDTELVFSAPLPVLIFGDHTRIIKFIDFPFVQGADGTQILIPKNDDITPVFFYFLTQSIDLANAFYARHFKFLKATEIILPTNSLIKQFERSVEVNMKQIKTLREMNIKLEKARDILLPRLMNGDLAV
jgi:type I restriction enzyme S subunit